MLKHLRRACNVSNNTGKLFVHIVGEKKFNSAIVARFKLGEVCGIGVAPHFCGAVIVANATAKTDSRATEAASVSALASLCEQFF